MADPKLDRLLRRFYNVVRWLGPDAFASKTSIVLYSGPPKELVSAIDLDKSHRPYYNHTRSERSAIILNATRIDDTEIGQIIFDPARNIYDVLGKIYEAKGIEYADKVNDEMSHLFASQAEGHVFTAVCGAARDRTFYRIELPTIIANNKVTHINGLNADIVRRQFALNAERGYRRTTQSEQSLMLGVAQNLGTADAFIDYAERRDFRRADRTLLRDLSGEILPGQRLPGVNARAREELADEKLIQRAQREASGLFRPWRAHISAVSKLGPKV